MSSVEKAAEVSSLSRPSARGLNRKQLQVSAEGETSKAWDNYTSVKLYIFMCSSFMQLPIDD